MDILFLFSGEGEENNHIAVCTVQFQKQMKQNNNPLTISVSLAFLYLGQLPHSLFFFSPILQTLQLLQSSLFQPSLPPPQQCFKSWELNSIRKIKLSKINQTIYCCIREFSVNGGGEGEGRKECSSFYTNKHFPKGKCKDDRDWGLTPKLVLPFLLHIREHCAHLILLLEEHPE